MMKHTFLFVLPLLGGAFTPRLSWPVRGLAALCASKPLVDEAGRPIDARGARVFPPAVNAARADARAAGDAMGAAAAAASAAWDAGDKVAAKAQSEAKTAAKAEMERANANAAALILDQGWRDSRSLDLHGLYVAEAEAAAREAVEFFGMGAKGTTFEIVTGAGHHSVGNNAKVRPVIERLLGASGMQFESEHGDGAYKVRT